jgi:hypothetical protein
MRTRILLAVLALAASTALAACGSSTQQTDPSTTIPVRFSETVTVPTTTVPTPTATSYTGPDGVPIETGPFLARATTTHLGRIVNGIQCQGLRQLAYRAYAHLQVYVHGQSRAIPGGIGLVDPTARTTRKGLVFSAHTCYYWLHTRAADGLIQVESPNDRTYTLGDLFKVWSQSLDRDHVAANTGKVTAIVNGKRWRGNPSLIPLTEHESIELAVAKPVPAYQRLDWTGTGY